MGYGPVNTPSSGGSGEELEAVRKLAQGAADTAGTAKNNAEKAQQTADAALQAANAASTAAAGAQKTADQALEAANSAGSVAQTAKDTADKALETANGAKSTADSALQAAQTAQQTADAAAASIKKLTNTISTTPSQNGTLTYNGDTQSPSWNSYDPEQLTLGGVTEGTNAGEYQATFTPKEEYTWADGTQDERQVTWVIKRKTVPLPTQKDSLTYSGEAQSPTWNDYSAGELDLDGNTSETNAGTYQATFTPKSNYQWSDGTFAARNASWSIAKAQGTLTLTPSQLTLDISALSKDFTVNRAGDGKITIQVDNGAVADATLAGTKVTVKGKTKGSAKVTVSVAAGTNHTAPPNAICTVNVTLPSKTLADNDPATIQAAGKAGTGATYWAVGDKIPIKVNGTFGGLTYNDTVYAFILGFNHNQSVEGNGIDFQFGKTADGKDIAFVQQYGSTGTGFCMNTTNTNSGGWATSHMNTVICPAFLKALPSNWQSAIKECTKYSDNTGNNGDTASKVTASTQKIFLLAEFEVQGQKTYANSAEQTYQKQYAYYANGNSKVKNRHTNTGSACHWWLRSVYATDTTNFCSVSTDGSAGANGACNSRGFAPGFKCA